MTTLTITFGLLAERLLPVVLRIPFWIAWHRVLLSPLQWLNDIFTNQVAGSVYLLNFNSQTMLLEWHLSNYFQSPITIDNLLKIADAAIVYDAALHIYTPIVYELQDSYDAMIVYDVQPSTVANYRVNVGIALAAREEEIISMVNRYHHAGFSYVINYV